MQLSVTFRQVDSSDAIKDYAREKLGKVQRLLDAPLTANLVLSVNKFRHEADINVTANGLNIHGNEVTEDLYSSIDLVIDKVGRQVKRRLAKIRNRKGRSLPFQMNVVSFEGLEALGAQTHNVLSTKRLEAKTMAVDEAVVEMDTLKNDFLIFINADNDNINVLYRRKDGALGLIEPYSR